MTTLTTYADTAPFAAQGRLRDFEAIAAAVRALGLGLERWQAGAELGAAPSDNAILSAYAADISRLKARGGYASQDVIRLTPDHPAAAELRAKFLAEHIHDDDEVRFFVEGSGLFYVHVEGAVHALECVAGDLVSVPAGVRHWFDMGPSPRFTCIRLFTKPEGWQARFTGDDVAAHIPLYDGALA